MARMQRATIEEAATALGVTQNVIELQIKSGSLVPCQDPSFRRCVWILDSPKAKPKRKAKATLTKDVDLIDPAKPADDIGLSLETVALLEAEPEITVPKPKRKARTTPKKDILTKDLVWSNQAKPDHQVRLLHDTIAMLKAELEIRDEQLDLLSVQLEMSREEVRKVRPPVGVQPVLPSPALPSPALPSPALPSPALPSPALPSKEVQYLDHLLSRFQLSESAHKAEMYEIPPPLPVVAFAGQPEILETVAEPLAIESPSRRARFHFWARPSGGLRQFVELVCLRFSPPLFH